MASGGSGDQLKFYFYTGDVVRLALFPRDPRVLTPSLTRARPSLTSLCNAGDPDAAPAGGQGDRLHSNGQRNSQGRSAAGWWRPVRAPGRCRPTARAAAGMASASSLAGITTRARDRTEHVFCASLLFSNARSLAGLVTFFPLQRAAPVVHVLFFLYKRMSDLSNGVGSMQLRSRDGGKAPQDIAGQDAGLAWAALEGLHGGP